MTPGAVEVVERKRASYRAWAERNPDYVRNRTAKWHRENPTKIAAGQRRWYEANKEKKKAASRARYKANKLKARAIVKDWHRRHPGKHQEYGQRRRARLRAAPVNDFTTAQWTAICEAQGRRCFYCAETKPLEQDHCVPLARGGAHTAQNIVGACRQCNTRKGVQTCQEFLQSRAA